MDMQNVWKRNADRRKSWTDKQLEDRRNTDTAKAAYNSEVESAISTLLPHVDNLAGELRSREETTDTDTPALLDLYIKAESLLLQLMRERKNNLARQSRYNR